MNIGLVLATYNEELNINELLTSIIKNLPDATIIIVDDSPTRTIEKIFLNYKNVSYFYRGSKLGRGSAVLTGIREILKKNYIETVIEIDTDLSHNPDEIPKNLKKFTNEKLDLLISSRYIEGSKILNWTLNRRIFSLLANFLAKKVLQVPVADYTNGFRIYSKKAAKHIAENCGEIGDGFIILSEILVELYFNNYKIAETKTIWKNRTKGKSTVSIREIYYSFIGLIKIINKKNKIVKNKL